jgi:hypothetical protein
MSHTISSPRAQLHQSDGPDYWTATAAAVGGATGLLVAGPPGAFAGAACAAVATELVRKARSGEDADPSKE